MAVEEVLGERAEKEEEEEEKEGDASEVELGGSGGARDPADGETKALLLLLLLLFLEEEEKSVLGVAPLALGLLSVELSTMVCPARGPAVGMRGAGPPFLPDPGVFLWAGE